MKNINNLYNKKIIELSEIDELIEGYSSNLILTNYGDSCGDYLEIQFNFKYPFYDFISDSSSCMLTNASYNYMKSIVSTLTVIDSKRICDNAINYFNKKTNTTDSALVNIDIFNDIPQHRISCLLLPWQLLQQALHYELQVQRQKLVELPVYEDASFLDCDSCIKVKRIKNSIEPFKKNKKVSSVDYIQSAIHHTNTDLKSIEHSIIKAIGINPLIFSKFRLNQSEINSLILLVKNWDANYIEYFRKYKMIEFLSDSILKYTDLKLPDSLKTIFHKKKTHNDISFDIWNHASTLLRNNNIPFTSIKGIETSKKYVPYKRNRFFSDIDILVPNLIEFFEVIETLSHNHTFSYHDNIGLAGSLKYSKNSGLSGHAHLLHFEQNNMFTIDLSFPHIPNAFDGILQLDLSYNGDATSSENLLLIALVHAFKHSRPPVKDFFDIFLLMKDEISSMDSNYLLEKINANNLNNKYDLICQALIKNYLEIKPLVELLPSSKVSLTSKYLTKLLVHMGWPYSKAAHQLYRSFDKYQIDKSNNNKKTTNFESASLLIKYLHSILPNRAYLIPLITVNHDINFDLIATLFECEQVHSSYCFFISNNQHYIISKKSVFALTPNTDISNLESEQWSSLYTLLIRKYGWNTSDIYTHYFYDESAMNWIYQH